MRPWWARIARFAAPEWRGGAAVSTLMVFGVGLAALTPWPLKLILDFVLTGEPLPESLQWLSTLPGAGSTPGLLAWLAASTVVVFGAHQAVGMPETLRSMGSLL